MGVFRQFPYSNFHEMNMDEILKIVKNLSEEWETTKNEWSSYKDFIDNYFENLDVSEEVLEALQAMASTGELNNIIDPVIANETTAWLTEHISPTSPAIDNSLTISGAGADAKFTGDLIRGVQKTGGIKYINTFNGKENFDIPFPVRAGIPFYVKVSTPDTGWFFTPNNSNNTITGKYYFRKYTPENDDNVVRFYTGFGSGYTGTLEFTIVSQFEYEFFMKKWESVIVSNEQLDALTGNSRSVDDFPLNTIVCIGDTNLPITNVPPKALTNNGFGVYVTFDGHGFDENKNGLCQFYISDNGSATRWKHGNNWSEWTTTVMNYAQYDTREDWLADFPSDMLADIPVNKIICIGSSNVNPIDKPSDVFAGNVMTLCANTIRVPGAVQWAYDLNSRKWFYRCYKYSSRGNYWTPWANNETGAIYHVGTGYPYTSITSLLLDLQGNNEKKTIYVHSGTYNIFNEYMNEVNEGRIEIPPDNVDAGNYFEPYNAFVPNNTRLIGLGDVTFEMRPTASQITYGASRTWSPLNIYGNVTIENIKVRGKNCRYCLHNDDHNNYQNVTQHYKNMIFSYSLSDVNGSNQQLGFNNTVGFGIAKGSTHIYDNCEFYFYGNGNNSAFYGHDTNNGKDGTIILNNCKIWGSDYSNNQTVRLQTLATSAGHIKVKFNNCYIIGGLRFEEYYQNSPQNFEVDLINSNIVPISRVNNESGSITDPYEVRWFNPLPTPTSSEPLLTINRAN